MGGVKAIVLREFGPPGRLVLEEVPDPEPADGQVVVEVEYVNITFIETQFRASGIGPFWPPLP